MGIAYGMRSVCRESGFGGGGLGAVLHAMAVGTVGACPSQKYTQVPFFHLVGIKKLRRLGLVSLMDLKQALAESSQAHQEWNRKYSSRVQEPGNCLSHQLEQATNAVLAVI